MAVIVREQVTLSDHTTLRLGGPAAAFIEASTDEQLVAVVRAADLETEPVLVLGGGSNLVVADEGFPGVVVHVATRGTTITPDGDGVAVTIAAGEDWDALVQRCVEEELSGLECMSGIPGLAGATPIQNVGAYGHEVAASDAQRSIDQLAHRAIHKQEDEAAARQADDDGGDDRETQRLRLLFGQLRVDGAERRLR